MARAKGKWFPWQSDTYSLAQVHLFMPKSEDEGAI